MSTYRVLRKIALLVELLKQELRPANRPELSDKALAALLNEAQASPGFEFDQSGVNQLLNVRMRLNSYEESQVLDALQRLIRTRTKFSVDVYKDPPKWVEDRYAKDLPEAVRETPARTGFEGERFGESATYLQGAWQFFVVLTPDDAGKLRPQIMRFLVIFFAPAANCVDVVMLTRRRQWTGIGHVLGNHLYIHARDSMDTKNVLFITNLPVKQRLMISGAGVMIEPGADTSSMAAVLSAPCFAEKWMPAATDAGALQPAIDRLTRGDGEISERDIETLRAGFVKLYETPDAFVKEHTRLARYAEKHKVNGKTAGYMRTLHVAYPS